MSSKGSQFKLGKGSLWTGNRQDINDFAERSRGDRSIRLKLVQGGVMAAGLHPSRLRTEDSVQAGHKVTMALSHLSEQIEEGGRADSEISGLQAGDEVVHINEVALSSSRREAVSLVKGSYKTLRLVVRR